MAVSSAKKKKKESNVCVFVCARTMASHLFTIPHLPAPFCYHHFYTYFRACLPDCYVYSYPPQLLLIGGSDDADCSSSFPLRTFTARDKRTCREFINLVFTVFDKPRCRSLRLPAGSSRSLAHSCRVNNTSGRGDTCLQKTTHPSVFSVLIGLHLFGFSLFLPLLARTRMLKSLGGVITKGEAGRRRVWVFLWLIGTLQRHTRTDGQTHLNPSAADRAAHAWQISESAV